MKIASEYGQYKPTTTAAKTPESLSCPEKISKSQQHLSIDVPELTSLVPSFTSWQHLSRKKILFSLHSCHEPFGFLPRLMENEIVSHNICTSKFSTSKKSFSLLHVHAFEPTKHGYGHGHWTQQRH